ncbi:MAG: recombinase RecA [Planctomycetes bacterium]|nr:recombinase RecA [Planctomycetota bacterium]
MTHRQSTGIAALDEMLGGGLLPGTLTVVVGATGIGKTQLGLQFAHAGTAQEGRAGMILDCAARGDSQNHRRYAQRMHQWDLREAPSGRQPLLDDFFGRAAAEPPGDYLHVFDYHGRRVTQRDLDFDQWREWQAELNAKLRGAIAFLYGNFVRGCRRVVVDGVEPADRPGESIQFNLFEYVYHQVVRKDPAWVARDLFREKYRASADAVAAHGYPPEEIGCLLLLTSQETMLDDLISRPLEEGDALANANTLIYMGKIRDGLKIGRALYIAKHRGSPCSDEIAPYAIDDGGVRLLEGT